MKRRKYWKRVVGILAGVVVFCTTYALILPAITLEQKAVAREGEAIGEELTENHAYIYDAQMQKTGEGANQREAISTGTEPFDGDNNPGNDSGSDNNVLRTFDVATYTLEFKTGMRQAATDQGINGYRTGRLYFELLLPLAKKEGCFELSSMGWLDSAQYETVTEVIGEKQCQVLRGSYLMVPSEANPAAIGNSYNQMSVAIRIRNMHNGAEVQPQFTLWLEGNEVGTVIQNGIPTSIVTESGYSGINGIEYRTVTPGKITISAAPRYNLAIREAEISSTSYVADFDFSTGNDIALYKEAGIRSGRLMGYGLTLQLVGKNASAGLKGVELPDEDSEITFDIRMTSAYKPDAATEETNVTEEYGALVWSAGPNQTGVQPDGRDVVQGQGFDYVKRGAPFNSCDSCPGESCENGESCKNGGSWTFAVDETDPSLVHVTVRGFEIDDTHFPNGLAGGTDTGYYYNPGISGWEVQNACFSAGELWIVQPFQNKNGEFIRDKMGNGTFALVVRDENLIMTSVSGQPLGSQAVTDDDSIRTGVPFKRPGVINSEVWYNEYYKGYGNPLTPGCWETGKDYALPGQEVTIENLLCHDNAEGENTGVAYEQLIKFDPVFYKVYESSGSFSVYPWWTPRTEQGLGGEPKVTYLWAANPQNPAGWDHNGKKPDEEGYDQDMQEAKIDDLIYFNSLTELEAAGYTCVGVLAEARGLATTTMNHFEFLIGGKVRESCPVGYVYMVTQAARSWCKDDVKEAAALALGKNETALTDVDYDTYVRNYMPSRSAAGITGTNLPAAFWNKEYGGSDEEVCAGLKTSRKSVYNKNGYVDGDNNAWYLDSCLVVEHLTEIRKTTAQTNASAEAKRIYNLDQGQRVVDYVLEPTIRIGNLADQVNKNNDITTTIYIEDTLPAELHYIPGSSYWGGTYTQDSAYRRQGTVVGGELLVPEVTRNQDGTTTLKWTLPDVTAQLDKPLPLDKIYFSCDIGAPGTDEDVKDQQNILNTVKIWSDKDCQRDFELILNNKAEYGITVTKTSGYSLSKTADQAVVDWWEPMGFSMNVGNNSATPMNDIVIVESLPYNGDGRGTHYNGSLHVSEFSAGSLKEENQQKLRDNLTLYYTTNEEFRDKNSSYYMTDYPAAHDGQKYSFEDNPDWEQMNFEYTQTVAGRPRGVCTNLPTGNEPDIVQIVVVGNLPAELTVKMHIMLELPQGQGGDYLVNQLSQDKLESYARTTVVNRTLEGLTWKDENYDGLQNESEDKNLSGVQVELLKLVANGDADNIADYVPLNVVQPASGTGVSDIVILKEGGGETCSAAYDPDKPCPDTGEDGSIKVTAFAGKGGSAGPSIFLSTFEYAGYDYIEFYAYTDAEHVVTAGWWFGDASLQKGQWTKVRMDLHKNYQGDSAYVVLNTEFGDRTPNQDKTAFRGRVILRFQDTSTGHYANFNENTDIWISSIKAVKEGEDTSSTIILTGQQRSVLASSTSGAVDYRPGDEDGHYRFTNLPAGTYAVRFTDGDTTKISPLIATVYDQGADDTLDSDGQPTYNEGRSVLQNTTILGIVMPATKDIYTVLYESKHHDSGFYERGTELPRTGGTGTLPYTFSGIAIMGGALLYYILKQSKQRKRGTKL